MAVVALAINALQINLCPDEIYDKRLSKSFELLESLSSYIPIHRNFRKGMDG